MSEIIKKILVIAFCLLASFCMSDRAIAQTAGKLQRAGDLSFANGDYYNAIKMYSAVLYDSPLVNKPVSPIYPFRPASHLAHRIKPSQKAYLQYQLAESYRLCYHYKEAIPQYEQYLSSQDTKFPLARLGYGLCLLANDQPDKALGTFNTFLQKYRTADSFALKAKQGVVNSNFAIAQKTVKPAASVSKLLPTVSQDGSNFALGKINDSNYLFTTSRHELDKKKEKIYPVRLYTGNLHGGSIKKIEGFPGSDMNMATPSLSADGLTLYFTGWKETGKTAKTYYRIFYTTRRSVTAQWSEPAALPAPVNIEGFHSKQPFITKDNKHLFFVSDRNGGLGKYDIWMIDMQDGKPVGNAVNAGNNINTEGDEASPFYDEASGNLYFSSNGRAGMGGMDIFSIKKDSVFGQWNNHPVNLGVPYNSVKDDDYYFKDPYSDTAYLSSDRASTCCMEIFTAVPVPKRDTVIMYVKEKEPKKIIDTIYVVKDENKRLMDSVNEVTVDRMYVNYRFASAKIRKEDYAQLNRIVQMLKKDAKLNILVASFADCIGSESANTILSRKRSASVKAWLIEKGISPSRININFFGKKHFVLACKEDTSYHTDKQMVNRRSDLIVTTEKNPKWQPSGKELDIEKGPTIYPKTPLHTVSVEESEKQNRIDNKESIAPGNKLIAGKPTETNSTTKEIADRKETGRTDSSTTGKSNSVVKNEPLKESKLAEASRTGKNNQTDKQRDRSKYVTAKNNAVSTDKEIKASAGAAKRKPAAVKDEKTLVLTNKTKPVTEPYLNTSVKKSSDSILKNMRITELLDFTPRLKKPTIIDQMTSRTPKKSLEVFSTSDSVKVELYDNGVFDYDTVSVIYNRSLVIYKEMLQTNKPITFYVKLNPEPKKNEMIFFAENLGLTPPNSALMIITDGEKKRTEINVSSDLDHNSVIYFIKVNKNKK